MRRKFERFRRYFEPLARRNRVGSAPYIAVNADEKLLRLEKPTCRAISAMLVEVVASISAA
jgi:hypothetical protein